MSEETPSLSMQGQRLKSLLAGEIQHLEKPLKNTAQFAMMGGVVSLGFGAASMAGGVPYIIPAITAVLTCSAMGAATHCLGQTKALKHITGMIGTEDFLSTFIKKRNSHFRAGKRYLIGGFAMVGVSVGTSFLPGMIAGAASMLSMMSVVPVFYKMVQHTARLSTMDRTLVEYKELMCATASHDTHKAPENPSVSLKNRLAKVFRLSVDQKKEAAEQDNAPSVEKKQSAARKNDRN